MPETILSLLTEQERTAFIEDSDKLTVPAGEMLFHLHDLATHMYRVERGKITLFRLMPNGHEKVFKVCMPGDLIAEVAIFMTPRQYPMNARADLDTELTEFSHSSLMNLMEQHPDLTKRLLGFMSNRICDLMNNMNILTQVNANQRLIMKLGEFYTNQNRHEGKLTLPVTKRVLASQLGMTPETLSRSLNRFKSEGLMQESGTQIIIPDFQKLCDSVDLTVEVFKPKSTTDN